MTCVQESIWDNTHMHSHTHTHSLTHSLTHSHTHRTQGMGDSGGEGEGRDSLTHSHTQGTHIRRGGGEGEGRGGREGGGEGEGRERMRAVSPGVMDDNRELSGMR